MEQGRVLVPLRAIFEALGVPVEWDGSTQTVTGRKGGTTVKLVVGQGTAYVNERPVSLDVPGKIINGRTMVPLRFIGESLGAEVSWDDAARTVIVRTGAGAQQDKDTVTEYFITPEGEVVSPKRITIKDSMERTVRVPSPPQRIVSVNSDVTELICAFGEEKRIVGVSDTADFPPLVKEKAKVGAAFTPNVEKILALRPDVVFGYGNFLKPEIIAQIERAGIPVVLLDCYKLSTMIQDIRTLGTILGRQKEAEAYIAYFEEYQKLFAERTKEIPLNRRPLVYLEGYTDYSGTGPGSGGAEMLECVGARSICAGLRITYPKVNAEWVVAQNPQVVIKACGSSIPSGYGESSEAMAKKRAEITRRPGWDKIAAVKQGKVFMLSSEIYTGPRAIVGMAYMAKWIYPDLFPDVDPSAIHREMVKKFHNLDLEGAYAYPEM